jgi:heptosyltransferase-2
MEGKGSRVRAGGPVRMKILVISMAGIGDTLLATPLIRELRANYPDARIDALVRWPGARDILEGNPCLNEVCQWDLMQHSWSESLGFLRSLWKQRYEVSLNTHPQSRIHYRLIARMVGARARLSHVYECSGLSDRLLVNRTLEQDYQKHTVEQNLAMLSLLGAKPVLPEHEPEIFLSPVEHEWAESFIAANQLSQRKLLGVHVGSGETKNLVFKRWPLENYIELFKRFSKARPDWTVLLFGGPAEEREMQRILAGIGLPFVLRANTKDLRQAAALLKRCDLFLSVDTALMHLAAAMRVPKQIVIEAPTFNATNEPYGHHHVLVKNPSVAGRNLDYYRYDGHGIKGSDEELLRCMASIGVNAVFQAVNEALGE